MTKKLIWLATFVFGAPAAIVWAFLLLSWSTPAPTLAMHTSPAVLGAGTQLFSPAEEVSVSEITTDVETGDARPLILEKYLGKYDSELKPFANEIVTVSDKYELDFRLLVAIAQQESSLCKKIPYNSYNCWGFGIYADKVTRFDSYSQAFDTIAKTLKKEYIDKGLKTPEQIMRKYTPPSIELGGPWAKGVNQFLAEME